jgi:hypothetical protein
MSSVIFENTHVYSAEQTATAMIDPTLPNSYLCIGYPEAWANDAAPPQANSSVAAIYDFWKNMVSAKLITGNDVRHAIPRETYASGTVYLAYDDRLNDEDMYHGNTSMHIVNSDWNVYKCLSNNMGQVSTVQPTQTITTSAVEESDGYIWKYMYTITSEERLRFVTSSYMPVRTLEYDNSSLQWTVQENAVPGAIAAIKVENVGVGYTNANNITVTITGDGTGAAAFARVNTTSNTISAIVISNPGNDYTEAECEIVDSGAGVNASARVIISPPGGHGADPMGELGGSYLIINTRLETSVGGKIPTTNQYRKIAIIKDPVVSASGNVASNIAYLQTTTITVNEGSSNFVEDEYVYQGGSLESSLFSGVVVEWSAANNRLRLTNTRGTPTADVITGDTSAAVRVVESITEKELDPYSGRMLYLNYIEPIQRAPDQTENFKFVIKF